MNTYRILLFVHVTSALAMVAVVGGTVVAKRQMADAGSLDALRRPANQLRHVPTVMKTLTVLLLVTGGGLAYLRGSLAAPWVLVAAATLVWLAATGALVLHRRLAAAVDAATEARAVTPDVTRRLHDPVLAWLSSLRVALFALLAFLMTVKPDGAGTAVALLVALALGALGAVVPTALSRWRVR
jgi:hypothetical protein